MKKANEYFKRLLRISRIITGQLYANEWMQLNLVDFKQYGQYSLRDVKECNLDQGGNIFIQEFEEGIKRALQENVVRVFDGVEFQISTTGVEEI